MNITPIPPVTVVPPGEGEHVHIPGFGATFKISSSETYGGASIVEHPFEVGTISAPHMHSRKDEYSIVVEGEIGFRSDESETVLGPGGYIVKPRGQMHAMWNAGHVTGRIIEIIIPGGFERYFRDLAELMAASTTDRSAFTELAAKYGLTYGHPEWLDDVVRRYGLTPPTH
ncbi:cupin domain-containing protein [Streptomyces sp. MI02-7b]|uniref:cupin domain-containing protein n=1 Tax=Streptomyces sp. MI02-7b TaxID=462941 RepID=UPI0029BA8572|nr:cupin domain-containing protein [Streptomyces sp. MI02-7b]MDX3072797.1 cupin domain-containing protein [Streptomyces sp. MI02-7b]